MYNHYNKLVRDKVPSIIAENGKRPNYKILDDAAYLKALDDKLLEVISVYQDAKSIDNIADIIEILDAICKARDYHIDDVMRVKMKKLQSRGGFENKVYLVGFEED